MEVRTRGKALLPPERTATYFGSSSVSSDCLSVALPGGFHLGAPGQTLGELWDTGLLIFPLFVAPPFRKEQASAISGRNGSTCGVCLPPAAATHGAERIKGFSRGGAGRAFTAVVPEPPLSPSRAARTEPGLPLDPVGCRDYRGRATTIWNRFYMEDLRFKATIFFSTTVFQVEPHMYLPYYKIDEKSC